MVVGRVVQGSVSVEMLVPLADIAQVASEDRNLFIVGQVVNSRAEVNRLIITVRNIEATGGPNGGGCRFDYRLEYESYEDYYIGRELFETVFYSAAKPKRTPNNSPEE